MNEDNLKKISEKLLDSLITKKNEDLIDKIKIEQVSDDEILLTWYIHIFLTKEGTIKCYEMANKSFKLQGRSLPISTFTARNYQQYANQIFQPFLTKQISDVLKYISPGDFKNSIFTTFHIDKNFNS